MKIYVVKYWGSGEVTPDDTVFLNSIADAAYLGTDYSKAMSAYKRQIRYNSPENVKFLSFEIGSFDDCTSVASVQSDAELVKIATQYGRAIQGICETQSQLVRNGKITIVLNKDYFNEQDNFEKYHKDRVWTRFNIGKGDKLAVLKEITEQWFKDNNIKVPFKVNLEGSTLIKINQK